jgi:hypothetical protein
VPTSEPARAMRDKPPRLLSLARGVGCPAGSLVAFKLMRPLA